MANDRLAELADELGLGFIVTHGSRAISVNTTLCALVGRSREAVLTAESAIPLFAPEARGALASLYALGSASPAFTHVDLSLLHVDGGQVPVAVGLSLAPGEDGTVDAVALVRDMRGDRQREAELDRLRDLVDRLPMGVLVWDARHCGAPEELRVATLNIAGAQVLGVEQRAAVGTTLAERFPDASLADATNLLALAGTGRTEPFPDVAFPRADGQLRLFRWLGIGLPEEQVAAVFEDITAERAEAARRRALLDRLSAISDAERHRLAIDIHDDTVQRIAAAALLIEGARRHADAPSVSDRLDSAASVLRSSLTDLRRLLFELSPPELTPGGLRTALQTATDHLFAASPTTAHLRVDLRKEPTDLVRTALYRIALEALTNVHRHARAALVAVAITEEADQLVLTVTDDGIGLRAAAEPGHLGIRSMQERAAAVGGTCSIDPAAHGRGTVVHARLPRHAEEPSEPPAAGVPWDHELGEARERLDTLAAALADARQEQFASRNQLRWTLALLRDLDATKAATHWLAQRAAEGLGRALRAGCAIHLLDPGHRDLARAGSWHSDPEQRDALDATIFADRPATSGHARTALVSRQPVLIDLTAADEHTRHEAAGLPFPLHSLIVAPVEAGTRVLGTVTAVRGRLVPAPFTNDDVEFVATMGSRIAWSLLRSRATDTIGGGGDA